MLCTYCNGRDGRDQRVDEDRRHFAVFVWARVRLGEGFVVAEEALDVNGDERQRVELEDFAIVC